MKNMNNNISNFRYPIGYSYQAKQKMSAYATESLNCQYVTGFSDAESTFTVKISMDSRTATG
jgi:hypothetical protein